MDATELEYQRIVDERIQAKMEARIKALALRAKADARRELRYHGEPRRSEKNVFQTAHGPAYSVTRDLHSGGWRGQGAAVRYTTQVTLPYISILGER